jgi:hypothetical protein
MNKRSIYFKLLTAVLCTTFLYGCGSGNSTPQTNNGSQTAVTEVSTSSIIGDKDISTVIGEMVTYDNEDSYNDWKSENPNYIELNGTKASIKGSGAEAKDSKITITKAGVYVVSGKLDNGQIIVDVQDKETVRLVLNGVEINSSDNAPIYVKNAEKTIISLEEGKENLISDGEKYVLSDASTDEPNAAIFSKGNLVINGKGKLTVHGNYNNGITSKDDLKVTGGDIQINSADDGMLGRDIVAVKEANITIEAGGDGIKATNDTDSSKGLIAIEAGAFNIKAESDGIQAETYVLIKDGSFDITSGGGSANGISKSGGDNQDQWGGKDDNATASTEEAESQSTKAIKASIDIAIGGGTINIDSADDAVHSNNNVTIEGGDISVTSGDDGIHADASIVAKGGKINITESYEGIESAVITVSDGEIHVTASDDGFNVAGGNDGSSTNGRPGENNFESSGNNKLIINGGYIVVNSGGDGLDSNGSIQMSNGTAVVNGPTANNNAALDYNGTFEMTGGFLISAGSSGMAQATSEESSQYSIAMTYPQIQQEGTVVHLEDSKGNTVATFAPEKEYQTVVISSPDLKKGTAYTLYSGGSSTGSEADGLYNGGKYQGGTKIVDFTISNSVTWLNESGVTTARSSHPGPGGMGGGKRTRPEGTPQQRN